MQEQGISDAVSDKLMSEATIIKSFTVAIVTQLSVMHATMTLMTERSKQS